MSRKISRNPQCLTAAAKRNAAKYNAATFGFTADGNGLSYSKTEIAGQETRYFSLHSPRGSDRSTWSITVFAVKSLCETWNPIGERLEQRGRFRSAATAIRWATAHGLKPAT